MKTDALPRDLSAQPSCFLFYAPGELTNISSIAKSCAGELMSHPIQIVEGVIDTRQYKPVWNSTMRQLLLRLRHVAR